jgi:hypothetical protein
VKNQKFRPRLSHNAPHHGRRAQQNGDSRPLFFGSSVKPAKTKAKVEPEATNIENGAESQATEETKA